MTTLDRCHFSSEGVPDREAEAGNARGAEVQVVVDEVEARLRTDEEVALGIELEAGTKVSHEVFVAGVVGVVAIAASLTVDTSVDRADATAKFKIRVAREFGCINGVEVKKDWTKRKSGVTAVVALVCLPVDFAADTEIVEEEDVAAKTRIGAAGERYRCVTAVG